MLDLPSHQLVTTKKQYFLQQIRRECLDNSSGTGGSLYVSIYLFSFHPPPLMCLLLPRSLAGSDLTATRLRRASTLAGRLHARDVAPWLLHGSPALTPIELSTRVRIGGGTRPSRQTSTLVQPPRVIQQQVHPGQTEPVHGHPADAQPVQGYPVCISFGIRRVLCIVSLFRSDFSFHLGVSSVPTPLLVVSPFDQF